MTTGPQRQVFDLPNGKKRIFYRNSDGKFISKSAFEKLLEAALVSSRLKDTEQVNHPAESSRDEKATNTGASATDQVEPGQPQATHIETANTKRADTTRNAEFTLSDVVKHIAEDEWPLIHEYLKINVDLLRSRAPNNDTPNAPPATASNLATNKSQPEASNARSGGVNLPADTVNIDGDVTGRDKNIHVVNNPLDPDKEREKNFQDKILGDDSDVRDKIKKHAQEAQRAGERPTFVNAMLAHRPLQGLNLEDADFCGADLTGANLSGATLTHANLSGKNTNLTNAIMKGTNCEAANFDEATLDGIQMQNVDLRKATLRDARLRGAQLDDVNLEQADLSGADLSGATLNKICLRETNLDGVTIDDTTTLDPECRPVLEVACWEDPNPVVVKGPFKYAVLRGANFSHFDLTDSDFSHANLDRAKLYDTCLNNTTFEEANLEGADLQRAQLKNAHLNSAYLGNAKLRRANLSSADLSNADLTNADLILADLTNADLSRANLRGTRVTQAQLDSAKSLAGATLPNGKIHP